MGFAVDHDQLPRRSVDGGVVDRAERCQVVRVLLTRIIMRVVVSAAVYARISSEVNAGTKVQWM